MTREIIIQREERKRAKNTQAYTTFNEKTQKSCNEKKEKWYNQKCDKIEENLRLNGTKKMHENLKVLVDDKKGGTGGSCIKDKNGKTIFERIYWRSIH